jgi:hypothetical protein
VTFYENSGTFRNCVCRICIETEVRDTCKSAEHDLSTYPLSLYVLCASCVAYMMFDHDVCSISKYHSVNSLVFILDSLTTSNILLN